MFVLSRFSLGLDVKAGQRKGIAQMKAEQHKHIQMKAGQCKRIAQMKAGQHKRQIEMKALYFELCVCVVHPLFV
jgi:hypothetical protein